MCFQRLNIRHVLKMNVGLEAGRNVVIMTPTEQFIPDRECFHAL